MILPINKYNCETVGNETSHSKLPDWQCGHGSGGMLGNRRIPLPACVHVEIKKEFLVEKHESYAGFDLRGIWRRLARVRLIFTLFILTNCNTNCSTTVKYWKNMAFFQKHFSPIHLETNSLLNHWSIDIHSSIYFNNTFNYGNGLSHTVDKQSL